MMKAWHRSITAYFFFAGVAWAAWLVRVPEIKSLMGVRSDELGVILVAGGVGALFALLLSNKFIERFGTKPALVWGFILFSLSIVAGAFSAASHQPVLVACLLFAGGFGIGLADVAQNVDGSQIEQKLERSIMPRLHAGYSFGTLVGAGVGTLCSALVVPVEWQMIFVLPFACVLILVTYRMLPPGTGIINKGETQNTDSDAAGDSAQLSSLPHTPKRASSLALLFGTNLILLGLGIFAITLVEGASNDWLALSLVENYGVTPAKAGIGFAFLVGAMTLTRYFGGNLVDRFGRDVILRRAALVGVAGILVIIVGPALFGAAALYFAWFAAALWGIGVALAFPLFLSAAGENEQSARSVSLVATCGYTAFLVGPPLLGFLGQAIGLLNMFYVLAGLLALAAIAASGAKPKRA